MRGTKSKIKFFPTSLLLDVDILGYLLLLEDLLEESFLELVD